MVRPPWDPDDPRQPKIQLADGLRSAIETGEYEVGSKLPSVRELAKTHDMSTTTVQRALDTLREEGLIHAWPGKGTLVVRKPGTERSSAPDSANSDVIQEIYARLDTLMDLYTEMSQRVTEMEEERRRRPKPSRGA